jgi:hypothetical protein
MAEIVETFRPRTAATRHESAEGRSPQSAARQVYVVFTSVEETLRAVRVAARFARALHAAITIVHFRPVPFGAPLEAPSGLSPAEADEFTSRLETEECQAAVRVCVCRDARPAIRSVLEGAALVVIGRRRHWWPTAADRWRRTLEAAGFIVVVVDALLG